MREIGICIMLIFFVLTACQETKKEGLTEEEKYDSSIQEDDLESKTTLALEIELKIEKKDIIEIYYYEPGSKTFHPKDFVSTKVEGSEEFQKLIIELPPSIYPERLRIDIGKNRDQEEVFLRTIKLLANNKEYEFTEK